MTDFTKYTNLNKTVTFKNGNEFSLFSKMTKRGIRYFYWSMANARFMPISKVEAGIV